MANSVQPGVYTGIVKDNEDKMGMGRVRVYIPKFGGDPTDETNWYTVSYMSPHGGQTSPYTNKKGGKKEKESQDSYGAWLTGYHKENQVVINFASADPSSGILMGGMFQENMSHSMGGYGRATSNQGSHQGTHVPVVEYNKQDDEINPRAPKRPRHERLYRQLTKQGLIKDTLRANTSTSPMRDPVPQFFSMKTPRGNFFVMDDGKMDPSSGAGVSSRQYARTPQGGTSMIRMRTDGGSQTTINDDCGFIHMISSDGNSWAQLGDNGVQFFTEGAIAMRVQGNYNMRVDGDYSSETLGTTSINVGGNYNLTTDGGLNLLDNGDGIKLQTDANYGHIVENYSIEEAGGSISQSAGGDILKVAPAIYKQTPGLSAYTVQPFTTGKAADNNVIRTTPEGLAVRGVQTVKIDPATGMPITPPSFDHSEKPVENVVLKDSGDTTLPDGGLVTHEPWPGQSQACGKPAEPAEETTSEEPVDEQTTEEVSDAVENGEFKEGIGGASAEDLNMLNDQMIADGYNKEQRAAMLGSWVQESGLNPNAVGDGGRSVGLAQWNGSRRNALNKYAASTGQNPNSLMTQYNFFKAETGRTPGTGFATESRAGRILSNSTSLQGAMSGMKAYERYGVAGRRYTYAQQIYGILK